MATVTAIPLVSSQRKPGWIYNKRWDLTYLILSAALVPVPLLFAAFAEASGLMPRSTAIDIVNILVAGLIGGPHLYSTFTLTYLNRSFVKQHPIYTASSIFIPAFVIYMGIYHYRYLILTFFTWASLHVLHQIIYIVDCYRERRGLQEPLWSRLTDYGVVLTALYPIGFYKLAHGQFKVAGTVLPYPRILEPLHLPELAALAFGFFILTWIAKTAVEIWTGQVSYPKTLLIGITAIVAFFVPLARNMDVSLQGFNTWHSFQYMFLFWLINRLRFERGEIDNSLVRKLVSPPSMLPYYLFFLGITGFVVLIVLFVRAVTPLGADQSYFIVVLSTLLVHYYFDHYLFTRTDLVR